MTLVASFISTVVFQVQTTLSAEFQYLPNIVSLSYPALNKPLFKVAMGPH